MIGLKIEDVKTFTSLLFVRETFDRYLVREAQIVTFNSFTIDGRVRHGYYTDVELEENRIEEYSAWKTLRPVCFSLIKGKKLPGSFQIVLQLCPADVEQFLRECQLGFRVEQIKGLYLNIRYEDGNLRCVTGTSIDFFTLDKSLDMEWDEAVRLFFKDHSIDFTEE